MLRTASMRTRGPSPEAAAASAISLPMPHGWFLTRQFENEANPDFHSRTTAREIVADFKGENLDNESAAGLRGIKIIARKVAIKVPDVYATA
jgi:cysteine synthase A